MTVDSISERFNNIEKVWAEASRLERVDYVTELRTMSDDLEQVKGPTAERAVWLERRIRRLVRSA